MVTDVPAILRPIPRVGARILCILTLAAAMAAVLWADRPVHAQSGDPLSRIPTLDAEQLRRELAGRRGQEREQEAQERVLRVPQRTLPPEGPSRVEDIFSERAGEQLEQFGYDTFTSRESVTLRQSGAVQDSYVLGQGDEVLVTLRGQQNTQYRQRVDRNGQVLLEGLEPISAAGRTFSEVRNEIEAAIERAYIATRAFVSLGAIRQVTVLVAGEVHVPGPQTLTGLSTPVDALILAGGVKKTGSLRSIRVIRDGRALAVDLYALLVGTAGEPGFHLREGDRIVVPPLSRTVAAVGAVRRPGIYELGGSRTIRASDLVSLAGGVEVRGVYRFTVLRTRSDGVREFVEIDGLNGAVIQDGDILFVQPSMDQSVGRVSLRGHTTLAGEFSLAQVRSMRDILNSPAALKASPYLMFGIISRRDPQSFARTLVPFSPAQVIRGQTRVGLQDHDIVWVFSVEEARRLAATAQAEDAERLERQRDRFVAERQETTSTVTGNDALASRVELDASQNEAEFLNDDARNAGALAAQGRFADPNGQQTFQQRPMTDPRFDRRNQDPRFGPQGQPLSERDRARRAGLQNSEEFGRFYEVDPRFDGRMEDLPLDLATLAEELQVDRRAAAVFLTEYISTIRGAVRVPGYYLLAPETNLNDLVMASGGVKRTADLATIEITATTYDTSRGASQTIRKNVSLEASSLAAIRIEPQDSIVLRDVYSERWEGRVNVFGEVRFPGSYEIVRGERLSSLIARAGGLTDQAYPYGAIYARRSVARIERESNERKAQDLLNLIVAQTSRREVNEEQIVFLQQLVRALRDQIPIGRIAVEADPNILAAKPELDIELEPGDALYMPSRPSTVTVSGQVLNEGAFQFAAGKKAKHYTRLAGGYSKLADENRVFVVYPDGTSERLKDSFWRLGSTRIVPGAVIVVPYDVSPFFLSDFVRDAAQVTSQLAITAASIATVLN